MKHKKLLPCPFCGGGDPDLIKPIVSGRHPTYIYQVRCKNENCELGNWIPIDNWQRRKNSGDYGFAISISDPKSRYQVILRNFNFDV